MIKQEIGVAKPSFLSAELERMREDPEPRSYDDVNDIKWAGAAMFGSTVTSLMFFVCQIFESGYRYGVR